MPSPSSYRESLIKEAEELTGSSHLPVSLRDLCAFLGIEVSLSDVQSGRALLVNAKDNPKILLSHKDAGAGSQRRRGKMLRFLIAHEIGHFLLQRRDVAKPLGTSEYWQFETVCDTFARQLLLPTEELCRLMRSFSQTPQDHLSLTLHLEEAGRIPWAVAALRVAEVGNTHFLCLVQGDKKLKVTVTTLPKKREIHRQIPATHELARLLMNLPVSKIPTTIPTDLTNPFPGLIGTKALAAVRTSLTQFRFAASH